VKIKNLISVKVFIILILLQVLPQTAYSQISEIVSAVTFSESKEGQPLSVRVDLKQVSQINSVTMAYRNLSDSEFKLREMELIGSSATLVIPGDEILVPTLTYYVIIQQTTGEEVAYPEGYPSMAEPLQIMVTAVSQKDKEIVVLSPAPGELVPLEDMFISISFIKAPENVDVSKTKIELNGVDISKMALVAGDLIIFYANNFPGVAKEGAQNLNIEVFDKEGKSYHKIKSNFQAAQGDYYTSLSTKFKYLANVEAESRNENFGGAAIWYNNLTANANGSYGDWELRGYAYLTSEEDKKLQPQHRFSVGINNTWLRLRVGDTYPRFPDMIMDGKRVRGVSGALELGYFNINATFGEIARGLEGSIIETYPSISALGENIIKVDSAKYGNPYAKVNLGTYNREVFAVRPSFGSGENFQLGFTYLHAIDDKNSIELNTPKENIVAGTDLKLAFDNQNIIFKTQASVSLHNSNITEGTFTDEDLDSLFKSDDGSLSGDRDQFETLRDLLGNFMTVNQFIGPINPEKLSSLGAEAELQLSYFNNSVRASYIYRGNDYQSFGQDFVRNDVKGLNVSDRIRLFDNRVFLLFGYEKLEDNLQETKQMTTFFETMNSSISYFPRNNFPNLTLGYSTFKNYNDIDTLGEFSTDDITNRISAILSYNFIAEIRHNASFNVSTSTREDNSLINADAKYTSLSLSVNSFWNSDLASFLSLTYYKSEISTEPYNYTMLSLGGKYQMLDDKLELAVYLSPSFGDYKRQSFDFIGQYEAMKNLRLIMQIRFYTISGQSANSISGLTLRYDI